jgi:hypothetical protein
LLGLLTFALFVGIAHACWVDGATPRRPMPIAGHANSASIDDDMAPSSAATVLLPSGRVTQIQPMAW